MAKKKTKQTDKNQGKSTPQQKKNTRKSVSPKKSIQTSKKYESFLVFPSFKTDQDPFLKKIFFGISAFVLFVMIVLSQGVGINGDDKMQNEYEQKLMSYYTTFGENKEALDLPKTKMHYYGGLFEVVTGFTNKVLGSSNIDKPRYHKVRHFYNALFGFLAMFFLALLAKELAGWRAGILALVFAFLSPRLLGHSLMNPKDIPFAAGYIISIYYIVLTLKELPKVRLKTMIGLALGIGIAIGVRAGGLLLIAYLGLFVGIHFLLKYGIKAIASTLTLDYLKATVLPVLGGLGIAILFWPYAMQNPVANILESLAELSKYGLDLRLLFGGKMIYAQSLPLDYLPRWVFLTIPFFSIIGLILFAIFSLKISKTYSFLPVALVVFAFIFPFVYVIAQDSTLYDGWRHLIFPYTCGLVLIALGWEYLFRTFRNNQMVTYAAIGVLALTALDPAIFIVRNPGYPHVYFNTLAGGVGGAFSHYETDYWGTSIKQGLDYLESEGIIGPDMEEKVIIATNFHYQLDRLVKGRYNGKVRALYTRYRERYEYKWDYSLFLSRYMDGSYLQNESWPSNQSIHTIDAKGLFGNAPLISVDKWDNDAAHEGKKAIKTKNWTETISQYEKEIGLHPNNELAWSGLATAFINTGEMEKAKNAIDKTLAIQPDQMQARNLLGFYYLRKNDEANALKTFNDAIKVLPKNTTALYYNAYFQQKKGNLKEALDSMEKYDKYGGRQAQQYDLAISVATQLNNTARKLYFQAKKKYHEKNYQESYTLVQQAVQYDKEFEPANELLKTYKKSKEKK